MTDSIRHTGRWTLEERFASPWHYLPVEVPPGTGALRVELDYDRVDGAVLDLGCFGPGGFRGWSGADREGGRVPASGARGDPGPAGAAGPGGPAAAPGPAGPVRPTLAGRRPALAHRALGR